MAAPSIAHAEAPYKVMPDNNRKGQ